MSLAAFIAAAGALAGTLPGPAPAGASGIPGPIPVEYRTADGVTIHGWYIHAGEHHDEPDQHAEQPAVVLLHMYGSDKRAWEPVIGAFREKSIALLMIDLRGHGESVKGPEGEDLARLAKKRDAALFRAMWQDAAGGVEWLAGQGHEPERIGLMGASVGCSVAIDCARRDPRLRTVAVLTPGANYLGVPTLEHLREWRGRRLLVVSSEEEAAKGAKPILAALAARKDEPAAPELWTLAETRVHGTRMFGKVEKIEERLAAWFSERL